MSVDQSFSIIGGMDSAFKQSYKEISKNDIEFDKDLFSNTNIRNTNVK